MLNTRLDNARIRAARRVLGPIFSTPRCSAARRWSPTSVAQVRIKLETANPVRSFKAPAPRWPRACSPTMAREPWCAPARANLAKPSLGPARSPGAGPKAGSGVIASVRSSPASNSSNQTWGSPDSAKPGSPTIRMANGLASRRYWHRARQVCSGHGDAETLLAAVDRVRSPHREVHRTGWTIG